MVAVKDPPVADRVLRLRDRLSVLTSSCCPGVVFSKLSPEDSTGFRKRVEPNARETDPDF